MEQINNNIRTIFQEKILEVLHKKVTLKIVKNKIIPQQALNNVKALILISKQISIDYGKND